MEKPLVIHVMVEVNVGTHHRVVQEKPPYLADSKSLVIQKYSSGGQRGLQKDSDGIHRQSCLFRYFFDCHSGRRLSTGLFEHTENAVLYHQAAYLKHYRREGYLVCLALRILC